MRCSCILSLQDDLSPLPVGTRHKISPLSLLPCIANILLAVIKKMDYLADFLNPEKIGGSSHNLFTEHALV